MLAEPEPQVSLCFCNQIERKKRNKVRMVMEDAEELERKGTAEEERLLGSAQTHPGAITDSHKEEGVLGAPPSIRYSLPLAITAFLLFFESPSLK